MTVRDASANYPIIVSAKRGKNTSFRRLPCDNLRKLCKSSTQTPGAQVDLVIDRKDETINITTYGIKENSHSNVIQSQVVLDDLFARVK